MRCPGSELKWCAAPRVRRALSVLALVLLSACAGQQYSVPLMPAPMVFEAGEPEIFAERRQEVAALRPGLLYATLRPPVEGWNYPFYADERGSVLRFGEGQADAVSNDPDMSDEALIALTFQSERPTNIRLRIDSVEEFGILPSSLTPFSDPRYTTPDMPHGDVQFAAAIEELLENAQRRDIYIYVHGFKVPFSDPLIVATEFWNFLGYQGAFIAFSWPSTPSPWAYLADADTAALSAHGFRNFLTWLSENTSAERIHIIGYSAGTRMVLDTLHQIALLETGVEENRVRLGRVILTGSDVDRAQLTTKLEDGILDRVDKLTLYMSKTDRALGLSSFLFFRPRIGQMWADGDMPAQVYRYLEDNKDRLALIDVSGAEASTTGNGHGYFRQSPWVSSDIVAALLLGIPPGQRGLEKRGGQPVWRFPDDYPQRLGEAVEAAVPAR